MDEVTRARFLALEARCEAVEARLRAIEATMKQRAPKPAPPEQRSQPMARGKVAGKGGGRP